jgi:hypothetical protein
MEFLKISNSVFLESLIDTILLFSVFKKKSFMIFFVIIFVFIISMNPIPIKIYLMLLKIIEVVCFFPEKYKLGGEKVSN